MNKEQVEQLKRSLEFHRTQVPGWNKSTDWCAGYRAGFLAAEENVLLALKAVKPDDDDEIGGEGCPFCAGGPD